MFEMICMSLLGLAYLIEIANETIEEKELKEKERIRDLKISVFCYAVRHKLQYDEVVKMIQSGKLNFNNIKKDSENYKNGI